MEEQSQLRVIGQLIERLTDKKHADLDTDALRRLKRLCKSIGDSAIKTCFTLLMEKIREQHARVCLAAHLAVMIDYNHACLLLRQGFRLYLSGSHLLLHYTIEKNELVNLYRILVIILLTPSK